MSTLSPVEQLEQGKRKLASLTERRTRVQVQLETARQQLADGRKQAEAEFKTSDVGALRAQLADKEKANGEALTQFSQAVTDYDAYLTRIEQALANPDSIPAAIAKDPMLGVAVPTAVPTPVAANATPDYEADI